MIDVITKEAGEDRSSILIATWMTIRRFAIFYSHVWTLG